jgi:hypothetical protein
MERPIRFEHNRYLGDKRTQVVYDLDNTDETVEAAVAELMAAETFISFGPDTLAEARNRGYKRCGCCESDASDESDLTAA